MRFRKPVLLSLLLAAFACVCVSQTVTEESDAKKEQAQKELNEKIVQTLDQVISDASLLRLPQNRALVFATAGDLYWKFDEKRARDLFRSAAGEIMAFNLEAEREKRDSTDNFARFFDANDPRMQVLPLVAKNDAELALEMLAQTRPAAVAEAMLKAVPADNNVGGMFGPNSAAQKVRREIEMEQRFAVLAADSNPDRAIKLIKDSLSKGVSYNVLPLLQKLFKKDEKKAQDLASEVVQKLLDLDLARKTDDLNTAISYLQFMAGNKAQTETASKAKSFQFTDMQAKDLAGKVANTFLQPANSANVSRMLSRALSAIEKIEPDKASLLKQRQTASPRSGPNRPSNGLRMQDLYAAGTTPEQIVTQIPKLQNEMERAAAYQAVASRIGQIDDEARAKKLIDQIADTNARERAQEAFDAAKISRAAATGKLEDAEKLIGTLTNKWTKIQKLVALAEQYKARATETDLEAASSLMKQARSLVSETPEDEEEVRGLMEVVRGYTTIEPETAFRMFEPIVDQMNEVVQASAVLSRYNRRSRSFKNGELILQTGNGPSEIPLFRYFEQFQLLGKADLARTSSLADRFQRGDVRILVKLAALRGSMTEEKAPAAAVTSPRPNLMP